MAQMNLSADMRRAAVNLFDQGKQADFQLDAVIGQFRKECARRQNLMRMFIEIQVQAAYADGALHEAEDQLLLRLCQLLGFHEQVYRQIEALVRASVAGGTGRDYQWTRPQTAPGMSTDDAYQLLGVSPQATDAEIKKAYRRLMSQHHPDKLVAKGLPEEMIKLATEKTQKIREAYELVKSPKP